MALAYHVSVLMNRALSGATGLALLLARPVDAQFARLAPPPPCRATVPSSAILSYWSDMARDRRPKVAIFSLQPEIGDADKVYLATALPERIRQRLSTATRIRVATEGSVARALAEARAREDSAARLLGADFRVTGRVVIDGERQEVEVALHRRGQQSPLWSASFTATTSFRTIEDAVVRGVSRALGLPAPPGPPNGWPSTDAAHDAVLAGDAYMRAPSGVALAFEAYNRALALEPGSSVVVLRLARASVTMLEQGGQIPGYPGASGLRRVNELVDKSFTLDSTPEAWTIRAVLARVIDPVRFTGAVTAHERALRLRPTSADAEHEYGATLWRLGHARDAEGHFRRALTLEPGRSTTFAALAEMELRASRWASACALSNASIAAWPYEAAPYATRAEARLHLADARDAYSDAELVRRLATGAWPDALGVLIANGASNVADARQKARDLTVAWLAPGNHLSVRDAEYLATAYLTMGDRRRAVESLRRARPMGADLRFALHSPRLAAIRKDTAIARILAESSASNRE